MPLWARVIIYIQQIIFILKIGNIPMKKSILLRKWHFEKAFISCKSWKMPLTSIQDILVGISSRTAPTIATFKPLNAYGQKQACHIKNVPLTLDFHEEQHGAERWIHCCSWGWCLLHGPITKPTCHLVSWRLHREEECLLRSPAKRRIFLFIILSWIFHDIFFSNKPGEWTEDSK